MNSAGSDSKALLSLRGGDCEQWQSHIGREVVYKRHSSLHRPITKLDLVRTVFDDGDLAGIRLLAFVKWMERRCFIAFEQLAGTPSAVAS